MKPFSLVTASLCLLLILLSSQIQSQSAIECRRNLNQVDSLLSLSKFAEAFKIYESNEGCFQFLSATRFYGMSQIYQKQGLTEEAKKNLLLAVERGLVNLQTNDEGPFKFYEYCVELGDQSFLSEVLDLHYQCTKKNLSNNRTFLEKFRSIEKRDQALRISTRYQTYAIYDWTGFSEAKQDSIVADMFIKGREKTYPVVQEFIDIISEKGYVPSDQEVFGMAAIPVLINHTCYHEDLALDSIYLHSIEKGTISPKAYAWFLGYRAEQIDVEDLYYYTHSADKIDALSEEKKAEINQNRWKIGLPMLPKTIYMPYGVE